MSVILDISMKVCFRHIYVKIGVSKSLGQGQGHVRNNDNLPISTCYCMWLQVIQKVKVTHQGEGHINAKVESRLLLSRGTQMHSCFKKLINIKSLYR